MSAPNATVTISVHDINTLPSDSTLEHAASLFRDTFPAAHYTPEAGRNLLESYGTVEGLLAGFKDGRKWYFASAGKHDLLAMLCLDQKSPEQAHIRQIVVSPEARGTGISARLINGLDEPGGTATGRWRTAAIQAGNAPSIGLFERLGFKPVDFVDGTALGLELNPAIDLHYVKDLDAV